MTMVNSKTHPQYRVFKAADRFWSSRDRERLATIINDAARIGLSHRTAHMTVDVPEEFTDWLTTVCYENRKSRITRQDLVRRALELLYVEVETADGVFKKSKARGSYPYHKPEPPPVTPWYGYEHRRLADERFRRR